MFNINQNDIDNIINSISPYNNIFTHLTEQEKISLFYFVSTLKENATVIEIGSYIGASTCVMAKALKSGKLFCIDTWENDAMTEGARDTYSEFLDNSKEFADKICPIRMTSSEAINYLQDEKVDLLFIDGDHSYQAVKLDWQNYSKLLNDEAIIIFHDTGWEDERCGVATLLREESFQKIPLVLTLPNMSVYKNIKEFYLIDFLFTLNCNYHCSYCDQQDFLAKQKSASQEVIQGLMFFLQQSKNTYIVQLIGGEPTTHPDFTQIAKGIVESGHYFQTCTNFSASINYWQKIIEIAKDKFNRIQISFHPSQVKDIKEFATKIIQFNQLKHQLTQLIPVAVLTEENREAIIELQNYLTPHNINLGLQHLRDTNGVFLTNTPQLQEMLDIYGIKGLNQIEKAHNFGKACSTGKNFFTIGIEGNISRCYEQHPLYYLGNIKSGQIQAYSKEMPCLSTKCTCALPQQYNMIDIKSEHTEQAVNILTMHNLLFKSMAIKYSIIIPTSNNVDKLTLCLEQISKLEKTKGAFEVIIIDNSSIDQTSTLVNMFKDKIDNLRYAYNKQPGLHSCRHLGAKIANGEILCYLDDDSLVSKNWLLSIEKNFSNSEIAIAAGNSLPAFMGEVPKWLHFFWQNCEYGRYLNFLSLINFFNQKMKVPTWFVFGCNFVIRKSILIDLGGFNPDSLPKELLKYRGDGETALSFKLNALGHVAYYDPEMTVHHLIPNNRLNEEYFMQVAFRNGISQSFTDIRNQHYGLNYDYIANDKVDHYNVELNYDDLINEYGLTQDDYDHFLLIKAKTDQEFINGYNYHKNAILVDSTLAKWVIKDNYFD